MKHPQEKEIIQFIWEEIESRKADTIGKHLLTCRECSETARKEFETMFITESWTADLHGKLYQENSVTKLFHPELIDQEENTHEYISSVELNHTVASLAKDLQKTEKYIKSLLKQKDISIYNNCIVLHSNLTNKMKNLTTLVGEAATPSSCEPIESGREIGGKAQCIVFRENSKPFVELEISGDSIIVRNQESEKIRFYLHYRGNDHDICVELQRSESQILDNLFGPIGLISDFQIKKSDAP